MSGDHSKQSFNAVSELKRRPFSTVWPLVKSGDWDAITDPELYRLILWGAGLVLAALLIFFTVINPGPPRHIAMTTGGKTGAYHQFAVEYQAKLAEHGIELTLQESLGSFQNQERLHEGETVKNAKGRTVPVLAAFVQSGTGIEKLRKDEVIESLASVSYEPIWVFHRLGPELNRLAQLQGKRIAIGANKTGAQFAAVKILEKTEVDGKNSQFLELGGDDALDALLANRVDAILIVASARSKTVARALESELNLMSFSQGDAYLRNFPWIQKITLPRGAVDMFKDLPKQDVTLIAATANLVVSASTHPALAYLLLDVASEVHVAPNLTQKFKEFPSELSLEFPQSDQSKRYFKTGRPFLQRYLPFWVANLIERILISVVPVLVLALPLVKAVPAFFASRQSARVSRLYNELMSLETEHLAGRLSGQDCLRGIESLEAKLTAMRHNSNQVSGLYNVKSHLDLLRSRVKVDPA